MYSEVKYYCEIASRNVKSTFLRCYFKNSYSIWGFLPPSKKDLDVQTKQEVEVTVKDTTFQLSVRNFVVYKYLLLFFRGYKHHELASKKTQCSPVQ